MDSDESSVEIEDELWAAFLATDPDPLLVRVLEGRPDRWAITVESEIARVVGLHGDPEIFAKYVSGSRPPEGAVYHPRFDLRILESVLGPLEGFERLEGFEPLRGLDGLWGSGLKYVFKARRIRLPPDGPGKPPYLYREVVAALFREIEVEEQGGEPSKPRERRNVLPIRERIAAILAPYFDERLVDPASKGTLDRTIGNI